LFETTLDKDEFIQRWGEYHRSANSDANVTLQTVWRKIMLSNTLLSIDAGKADYAFIFSKETNKSRIRRTVITARAAGGYVILQSARTTKRRE
jgi:hypothetical protein